MDSFASGEVDGKCRPARVCRNMDALSGERFEMHLNAGCSGIPEHFVTKLLRVEIGAQVAVQTCKDIQVEGGSGSGRIIVGGEQGRLGLVLCPV